MVPQHTKVLVLNDDYTPLNVVTWERGISRTFESLCDACDGKGHVKGKKCTHCNGMKILPRANVVEYYEFSVRDSKGRQHPVPAVIANTHHVHRKFKEVPYSKANILRRDNYTCQYCGERLPPSELTLDHVVPRSIWKDGTPTCWKNVVACCRPCNHKKANRTPEQAGMQLRKQINGQWINYKYPKKPSQQDIVLRLVGQTPPKEWTAYIAHFLPKS